MLTGEAAFVSLAATLAGRPCVLEPQPLEPRRAHTRPDPDDSAHTRPDPDDSAHTRPDPDRPAHAYSKPERAATGQRRSDPADREPCPVGSLTEHAAAVRDARLFRAALADAFDGRLAELMRGLAGEVLGRELRLAAVEIETLARRLLAERAADEPLRLRVALADSDAACDLPVIPDPDLQPGDAVLECRSGDIDARLRVRLAGVLMALQS